MMGPARWAEFCFVNTFQVGSVYKLRVHWLLWALAQCRAFKFPQLQCEALQTLITSLLSQHQQSGRASQTLQLPEQLEARWLTLKARWLKLSSCSNSAVMYEVRTSAQLVTATLRMLCFMPGAVHQTRSETERMHQSLIDGNLCMNVNVSPSHCLTLSHSDSHSYHVLQQACANH
jgi:hypothetical protein